MFILVLVIFFFGFGFCGFMAFSSDVDDFRSLIFAFFNMIRFVIGDVNYDALQLSSRTWGSVYYVAWSILMLLVLTNVFIAILSEAYGETIEEMSEEDKLSLGFFGMRGAMARIQQIFKNLRNVALADLDEDGDGQLDAHELANKTGWTVEDAQKFIDEHDKDKNGKLSEKEWEALMKEAEEKKQQTDMETRLATIGVAAPSSAAAGIGATNTQVSFQQYQQLSTKMNLVEELLRAQLQQTKTGTRALKEIDNKKTYKHPRKTKLVMFYFFFLHVNKKTRQSETRDGNHQLIVQKFEFDIFFRVIAWAWVKMIGFMFDFLKNFVLQYVLIKSFVAIFFFSPVT
ncbi:hypothetical protein RFI_28635 [Reticulomyxa filosa]|uniref:EF-hand domain-containing protein n=1 Tax=Reticulomyxa filosa TaxID=46433 RepID=X6M435_RETFI|nr:hypothetical protein RFI_28635 [Reticulomyxa filosa]|eukprot:ETO08753.1 hypothetical protein RFI_28635 [Reticulomyxa filosa]